MFTHPCDAADLLHRAASRWALPHISSYC